LTTPFQYVRSNHVNKHLINRLGLETSLQGHQGCVNCLEWNERGTHLASGSDDCCLILWDPFEHKNVFVMNTGHVGNIFSVKFLPNVNEYLIVTGAADAKVRVHDVSRMETRHVFSCHSARIKRLANTPSEPFLFWSASEDGTVRQFDLRDPTQAGCEKPRNVLVNLQTHIGSLAEAKCLALNPLRPEMLAVGSNDPYVRVYDRRKLSLCVVNPNARLRERRSSRLQTDASSGVSESDNETTTAVPSDGVRYFIPGHLPCKEISYRRCFRHVNVTCVSFSPDGSNLLANMGGDHIYLFNLKRNILPYRCSLTNTANKPPTGLIFDASSSDRPLLNRISSVSTLGRSGRCRSDETSDCDKYAPSPALVQASIQAACLIKAKAFVAAVRAYNEMIQRWPTDPQLYTGRATALLRRGWTGDIYSALLDCQTTLNLTRSNQSPATVQSNDCMHVTALLLSARCLLRLDWVREARVMLDKVQQKYSHWIRPPSNITELELDPSSGPGAPNSSVSVDQFGQNGTELQANATENSNGLNLHKFFHSLDCEIQSKEAESTRTKESKEQKSPNEHKAEHRPVDGGRDLNKFLVLRQSNLISQENGSASFSDTSQTSSTSSSSAVHMDSSDVPEPDSAHTTTIRVSPARFCSDIQNAPDEQEIASPLCSCIGCVTNCCRYDHEFERQWRANASDYTKRFLGHCNAITDIKEANFFGGHGQYIVGGSDCGSFFVWDRDSTNIVRILEADSSTVNCVQPHPSICLLASSGIDSVVRLWSPKSEDDPDQSCVIKDHVGAAERNQRRTVADPLEVMLLNMGYVIPGLDVGFRRRRNRTDRRRLSTERSLQRQRARQQSDSSSAQDDDVDFHANLPATGLEHSFESANLVAENEHSGARDLEGLSEVQNNCVSHSNVRDRAWSAIANETNGTSQPTRSSSQSDSNEQADASSSASRVGGRASRGRESDRTQPAHGRRKRLRSDTTSILQPQIALSAFDDDSTDSELDFHPSDHTSSSVSQPDSSSRRPYSGSQAEAPFLALHSVLHNGDHFVVYGTAGSNSTREREQLATANANANPDTDTTPTQSDDNTVLEIPCTMS
ncbi:hypothetical protein EG68_05922, partial [Paragonimus skrjabini miyazakii]